MHDALASAPGRVNLIGEHTDYNGGFVLPMPIPRRTSVILHARRDAAVRVTSREFPRDDVQYQLGQERRGGTWLDYVMGCTAALRSAGHTLGGCELAIASEVPVGSGLSSSAALEIAVLRALRDANELAIDDVALALFGQRAENELVGAPSGAMDQIASSVGIEGEALFVDMRDLRIERVPLPPELEVLVISSGIQHAIAGGDYRTRRMECEEAARRLGVSLLRELGPGELVRIASLPAPLDRRARHVVTENERVIAAVAALHHGAYAALGPLFIASHASLRDDFEVSLPDIDVLVAIATADQDILGARLTGGGFGGSIVALAAAGAGAAAAARVCARYRMRTGREPAALLAWRHV